MSVTASARFGAALSTQDYRDALGPGPGRPPAARYYPAVRRIRTPELMDDPAIARDDLAGSLAYIRRVNRRLGGAAALIRLLRTWSGSWPRDRPVTLLDVGTGSADIPVLARRWALAAGLDLRITAIDLHPTTLELAREHIAGMEGISLVRADALRLTESFAPGSFDYVHAGMFMHHLADIEVMTVLRSMDRIARAGLVWNDLVRSRLTLAALHVLLVGQPRIVRHDAIVSIRAGFTAAEVMGIARRVGIDYARFRRRLWYRFTVAGEKPGAWDRR